MAVQSFKPEDIEWAKQAFAVSVDDIDETDPNDPVVSVGDTVRIKAKGKGEGKVGVVVQEAYGTVVVEPYNDPYWNDPRVLTKLGPYSVAQVEKVKRPKGASTDWVEPVKVAVEPAVSAAEVLREQIGGAELVTPKRGRGRPRKVAAEPAKAEKVAKRGRKAAKVGKVAAKQAAIVEQVLPKLGNGNVTRDRLIEVSQEVFGIPHKLAFIYKLEGAKVKRGLWSVAKIKSELGIA